MIAASTFASDQLVTLLARLNRGERIAFSQEPDGPLAFSVGKADHRFVLQDAYGRPTFSAPTFAEAWRERPRSASAQVVEAGR